MRTYLYTFKECPTREDVEKAAPWAAEIVEVDGGWAAFESVDEYNMWMRQL